MRVLVGGATGLVGRVMLKVLEERGFPVDELIPAASEKSNGKDVSFRSKSVEVVTVAEGLKRKPQLALFSMGGVPSLEWAPRFEQEGCYVVDNSSAWRMNQDKKLIVPEINAASLKIEDYIIANPNCSTIQMVMALAPLHWEYGIKRVVVSTYQSVSGTGSLAVQQLENERAGIQGQQAYPHAIDLNCFPHGGVAAEDGYTSEEIKLVNETRKILSDDSIQVTATVARIPVTGGHSESVNVEFKKDFDLERVKHLLSSMPGVVVEDDLSRNKYPTPQQAHGKDDVFVGRIRRDLSQTKSLNLWIVSDNLRKGAATNAVQIAEYLVSKGWI